VPSSLRPPSQSRRKRPSAKKRPAPGKQRGARGFGRTVELAVIGEGGHRDERCAHRGEALDETAPFPPITGLYVVDVEAGPAERRGLTLSHTKHLYGQTRCGWGQRTATAPGRNAAEAEWSVPLSE